MSCSVENIHLLLYKANSLQLFYTGRAQTSEKSFSYVSKEARGLEIPLHGLDFVEISNPGECSNV